MNDENLDFLVEDEIESTAMPSPGILARRCRQECLALERLQNLKDVMKTAPKPGIVYWLLSGGKFDYWSWVPCILDWLGKVDVLYLSTWTVNRQNVVELFQLFDAGRIGKITFLSGLYFKRREQAVYAQLLEGLQERGQRFKCFENHTKLMLLSNVQNGYYIVNSGSANLTANPRHEANQITNDKTVFDFHKKWMDGLFHG